MEAAREEHEEREAEKERIEEQRRREEEEHKNKGRKDNRKHLEPTLTWKTEADKKEDR